MVVLKPLGSRLRRANSATPLDTFPLPDYKPLTKAGETTSSVGSVIPRMHIMHDPQVDPAPPAAVWRWRLAAAALLIGSVLLRLLYLANSPLDLAPDEAHYWDWSRHLDWSYYSKGPLVAYLIRLGCELFGGLSVAWTGTEMLAVRWPAVLGGSLFLLSLYVLTARITRRESLALLVIALALTLPIISVGSSLMTIDAPYTCLWGWALVAGHGAVFRPARGLWALTGLLIGLGILAKYTMIVWLPSLGLFLLTSPEHRRFAAPARAFGSWWALRGLVLFAHSDLERPARLGHRFAMSAVKPV